MAKVEYRGMEYLLEHGRVADIATFLTPKQYAKERGCTADQVRAAARAGKIRVYNLFDTNAIVVDPKDELSVAWEPGVVGSRRFRTDGRSWFRIALNRSTSTAEGKTEVELLKEFMEQHSIPDDAFIDPRERRKAKKAKEEVVGAQDDSSEEYSFDTNDASNPFADFTS